MLANKTNPEHYKSKNPEPIAVILAWDLNYLEGNVVKYLARWREKNGIEDLRKARVYLDWLIEIEENRPKSLRQRVLAYFRRKRGIDG